ncbi:Exodeoxyribonuclease 7 large subunit [Rubripirellula obstinata]|uniref:Exodeoxyribonuclease 7 large subunit n=1 Tax=Rubripirellula obstinata TaxID=406547 RepID=A0A5B1CMD3_9BACT|nr:exodeoxyribonuclease VII large subunit [Rubripirellula obstinata]KAA1261065.1 Exodeoxyribonuclease 7 large subunit [Rubripirellula obstinata]
MPSNQHNDDLLVQSDTPHSVTVSELTGHIKAILEGTFPSIWVAGEISDLVRPRSGHLYFTLKDNDSQIRGIIWRSTASRMKEPIKEGQSVLCFGDVEVYAARGSYQMVVRKLQMQGLGPLQQKFELIRAKLQSEGLFSADRKQSLPTQPRRIGVITSPSGAAVRDFLKSAMQGMGGVEFIVIPALVQGVGSAKSVVDAMKAAQRISPPLDLVVLTRGGGSMEDLWTFNEESVVRAVANSKLPTVSAIGHEIDVTLCDLAADVRALTPTAAATTILPDAKLVGQTVSDLRRRLERAGRSIITQRVDRLNQLESRTVFRKPHEVIHNRSRQLDELDARGRRAMFAKLQLSKAKLQSAAASLSALSPLQVLTRGYSVTVGENGKAILDAKDVVPGEIIHTRVHQGEIKSVVQD